MKKTIKKVFLLFIILLIAISNLFLFTSTVEANTYNSSSSKNDLKDRLFLLFFTTCYLVGVTLLYKRFFCRGKYGNPIIHLLFLMALLPFSPLFILYLFIIEPILLFLEHKRGKQITNLKQIGICIGCIPELKDLTPITSKDSSFNKEKFINNASKLFFLIRDSRINGEISNINYIMSDGLCQHFENEQDFINENKAYLKLDKAEIDRAVIISANFGETLDEIYVALNGAWYNSIRDKNTNKLLLGYDDLPNYFEYIWRFTRFHKESSSDNNGLLEKTCPKCSSPLQETNFSKICPRCKADLNCSEWTVTGIAYQNYSTGSGKNTHLNVNKEFYLNRNISGLSDMLSKDPLFSLSSFEDRLITIFWKIVEAIKILDIYPIKAFCNPDFLDMFKNTGKIEAFPSFKINEIKKYSVLSIITNKGKYDHIIAEVSWVAKNSGFDYERKQRALFVFRRDQSALTTKEEYFNSLHCPNCNSLIDTNNDKCSKCNFLINDDSKYWILENIISPAKIQIEKLNNMTFNQNSYSLPIEENQIDFDSLNNIPGNDIIRLTIAVMLADGIIDKNEVQAIVEIGLKKGIQPEKIKEMISEIKSQADPLSYVLNSTSIKKDLTLLLTLINIAASDGKITNDEAQLLYRIADIMKVHKKVLYDMINSAYQSKDIL